MFSKNLTTLRKFNKMTQEELAEKVGVSRQSVAKWETGESVPDIEKCKAISEVFSVSLDELVNNNPASVTLPAAPKGKHIFGVVKVGDKGQIVIPANVRQIFNIEQGDELIVLGDDNQGLALLKEKDFMKMANEIRKYL